MELELTYNLTEGPVQANSTLITYEAVKDILFTFVVPIIIVVGFVGNTICFVTFIASPLSRISTSSYLAALAFSDTGFLSCLGVSWLESLGIRLFHTNGICQVTVYASFVFSFTSIWYVNAFTMELYIAVFYPEKRDKLYAPRTAKIAVVLLFLIAAIIYMYVFWISRIVTGPDEIGDVCMHAPNVAMLFSVLDTILTLIVPFVMIIVMMIRLFCHIRQLYSIDNNDIPLDSQVTETEEQQYVNNNERHLTRQGTEARSKLTRMLVVTVLVFLLLNLPSHAIKVQFSFRFLISESVEFTDTEGFIQVIFQTLYYANFSINFLLYSVCSRSFRNAMFKVSFRTQIKRCCICCKQGRCHSNKDKNNGRHSYGINDGLPRGPNEQHSRLVDIHLQDIRESQLPSLESQFVCQSPPCLLAFDSESNTAHNNA